MSILDWLGRPVKTIQAPAKPTPNVKMVSMEDVCEFLGTKNAIDIKLLKEGCKICNIPFLGGGKVFVNSSPNIEEERQSLKQYIWNQLTPGVNYLIAYAKIVDLTNKPHPQYAYYNIIGIKSNDMLDLKKAFKIQKLKAFL